MKTIVLTVILAVALLTFGYFGWSGRYEYMAMTLIDTPLNVRVDKVSGSIEVFHRGRWSPAIEYFKYEYEKTAKLMAISLRKDNVVEANLESNNQALRTAAMNTALNRMKRADDLSHRLALIRESLPPDWKPPTE
jgi:hypothetical protein